MDIRRITDDYAVSPQIDANDMADIVSQGFVAIICNRPDGEVGPDQSSARIRTAADASGLAFHDNPVVNGAMGPAQVEAQARTLAAADGPVLAYCRSGTRSCFVWAFGAAGEIEVDRIVALAGNAGYDLTPVKGQLAAVAAATCSD